MRIIIQTLAKHTNTESMSGSPRRLMPKILRCVYEYTTRTVHTPPMGEQFGGVYVIVNRGCTTPNRGV